MNKIYFSRENIFFFITLILCIIVLFKFLFPFVLGVTFAYLLEPAVEKVVKFFHARRQFWRWTIAIAIIIVTIALIFGPILTLITTAVQELSSVFSSYKGPRHSQDLILITAARLNDLFEHFGISFSIDEFIIKATAFVQSTSHTILAELGEALYATPEFVIKFIVFLLTWCFFLVKGSEWRERFLVKVIPWEKDVDLISHTCSSILKALIVANALVAVAQAFLITLTLAIFGVPQFILLGMIAFFISFVPIIGTAPLMLCASAWCYFSQGRLLAAIGILVSGILISILDNILRPYFMKGGAELHFFWIFLAIVCGISLFGIPGAVMGPVFFALFAAALRTLELTYEKK